MTDGTVAAPAPDNRALTYAELIGDARILLALDPAAPLEPAAAYRVVGRAAARVDLPAKATGDLVYVHDMRVPGMLHGRVVRPPYAGPFVGTSLAGVDERLIAHIPEVVKLVVIGDFIGIVAEREEQAQAAAEAVRVLWKPVPDLPDVTDIPTALRANPATWRELLNRGDVAAARSGPGPVRGPGKGIRHVGGKPVFRAREQQPQ